MTNKLTSKEVEHYLIDMGFNYDQILEMWFYKHRDRPRVSDHMVTHMPGDALDYALKEVRKLVADGETL